MVARGDHLILFVAFAGLPAEVKRRRVSPACRQAGITGIMQPCQACPANEQHELCGGENRPAPLFNFKILVIYPFRAGVVQW